MSSRHRILLVGCGNMGLSHAKAYAADPRCEIIGVVTRTQASRDTFGNKLGIRPPGYSDLEKALVDLKPSAVCISTYPDTHAEYALLAMRHGVDVFLEKPIATTAADAEKVRDYALKNNRKLVVGYILRSHPTWREFIAAAQKLGKPLVMRMNLNQQSHGNEWTVHKNIMQSLSPIVDCGVHYVDVMCQMTEAKPVRVYAIGARLTDEIAPSQYNYGCLQVAFDDGSVGWYEAGWGPMMSHEAFFIKDVTGPKGSVSLVGKKGDSDDIEGHTRTGALRHHFSQIDKDGEFIQKDVITDTSGEPDHDRLCALEQEYFLSAIEEDRDLTRHIEDAVHSLKIVLAADESIHTGKAIPLD